MHTVGIICEYNPLHLGHCKQFRIIREHFGDDTAIVCLMSGNFVQRGAPAVFSSEVRAKAAVEAGADLVLELPINASLSSAEGFASHGVRILSPFCDYLCFGAETADSESLSEIARALLNPEFSEALRAALDTGISFPSARQAALERLGIRGNLIQTPNNILGVEYCKAILVQGSSMIPFPIPRDGNYHDTLPNPDNPSATSLRALVASGGDWLQYVPKEARDCCSGAVIHHITYGERAILARLRTMTDAEFEALPYGSEGLWRKLMHASRHCASLEDILEEVKTKRYARSRLDRMIMCAYLGLDSLTMTEAAPYTRVLGFSERGRSVLKTAKQYADFRNAGESTTSPWQAVETRVGDLYGLFADRPEAPGMAASQRVYYKKDTA